MEKLNLFLLTILFVFASSIALAVSSSTATITATETATKTITHTFTKTFTRTASVTATFPTSTPTYEWCPGGILADNFEGTFAKWVINTGPAQWGLSSYRSFGGSSSAWCAKGQSATRKYLINMDAYMQNASGNTSSTYVSFYYWIKTADVGDWMVLQRMDTATATWITVWGPVTGTSGGWIFVQNVSIAANSPNIRFLFHSNDSGVDEGAYIDNVCIKSSVLATHTSTATISATFTKTATATRSATKTPTDTATDTLTFTDTETPDTATFTATSTKTATSTATNTVTNTRTVTDTVTDTVTSTSTMTSTLTMTSTSTVTVTNTTTSTSTLTATVTATSHLRSFEFHIYLTPGVIVAVSPTAIIPMAWGLILNESLGAVFYAKFNAAFSPTPEITGNIFSIDNPIVPFWSQGDHYEWGVDYYGWDVYSIHLYSPTTGGSVFIQGYTRP